MYSQSVSYNLLSFVHVVHMETKRSFLPTLVLEEEEEIGEGEMGKGWQHPMWGTVNAG